MVYLVSAERSPHNVSKLFITTRIFTYKYVFRNWHCLSGEALTPDSPKPQFTSQVRVEVGADFLLQAKTFVRSSGKIPKPAYYDKSPFPKTLADPEPG